MHIYRSSVQIRIELCFLVSLNGLEDKGVVIEKRKGGRGGRVS